MVRLKEFKKEKYTKRLKKWILEDFSKKVDLDTNCSSCSICILNGAAGQFTRGRHDSLETGDVILVNGMCLSDLTKMHCECFAIPHRPFILLKFPNVDSAACAKAEIEAKSGLFLINIPDDIYATVEQGGTRDLVYADELPGLELFDEFITELEELAIVHELEQDSGWTLLKDRKVLHFGYGVKYSETLDTDSFFRVEGRRANLPSWCGPLVKRYRHLLPDNPALDQLTANFYAPGQGIAPHIDSAEAFLEPLVVVSLLVPIVMEFKATKGNGAVQQILLPPRSLLVMKGASRYHYTHAIKARTHDFIGGKVLYRKPRYSLTFRSMKCI